MTHRYNKNGDEVSQDWERRWKSDGYALDTGSWDYTYEYDIDGNKTKIHEIKKHNGRVTEDSETFFTYQYY
ncbi:hypothetical protein [Mucilaginibacter flavidus]|uniref:hypothetical protein n=1 Tax=Mucilaginibacter flavidus TaxID=2949309 RepID=UPI002093E18E|nr:hypothetical protein [Mucilaginibacter flavidus]MCO5951102.1 hypothetical protein [Mucilaginibacter flavidus]